MGEAAQTVVTPVGVQPPTAAALTRKRTRRVKIPWSQLSLMASLCFGIGSFVLPDSVNSGAAWLLWGLTAASAYVWFANRRARVKSAAT